MDGGSSKRIDDGGAENKPSLDHDQNQNASPNVPPSAAGDDGGASAAAAAAAAAAPAPADGRRPFTSLSQEEADLALARVLQEQERAYMMLTGGEYAISDYDDDEEEDGEDDDGSEWEEGEALNEDEQVGDAAEAEGGEGDLELDPSQYEDDEAFARALQDAEGRDVADRLMALVGIGDWRAMEQDGAGDEEEEDEDDGVHTQDAWEDVDPDEYSYEELIALGEVVGTESKGLAADTIASLPSVTYQAKDKQDGNMEQCVICRVEFDEGESLVALPCKHPYHSECINQWLQLNKVCPMCSAEVSTSVNKQA